MKHRVMGAKHPDSMLKFPERMVFMSETDNIPTDVREFDPEGPTPVSPVGDRVAADGMGETRKDGLDTVASGELIAAKQEIQRLKAELECKSASSCEELRLASAVCQYTSEGVVVTDLAGVIISVNPAFREITGYTAEEALGRTPNLLCSDQRDPEFYRQAWANLEAEGGWQGEIWNRHKNGEDRLAWLSVNRIDDDDGKPLYYVGVFHDITESRRKDLRIQHLAYHDALTGLPNRALLLDRLGRAIESARRGGYRLGILFIDLDRFKGINDSLGHAVGDVLLQAVAERLASTVRATDTIARMGGDEFVVLIERVAYPEDCAVLAEKIHAVLGEGLNIQGYAIQVGGSIGIAVYPNDGTVPEELMKSADAAMYAAKSGGGSAYEFFQPAMTERAVRRLTLEMELRCGIRNRELEVHYQPKLCLKTRTCAGFEALVRWRHPQRGLVPPGEFIPIAEETGLIGPIGNWVLEESCRQVAQWRDQGLGTAKIAVNLSAKQLRQGGLMRRIKEMTGRYGLSPAILELELTETTIMADPEFATEMFRRLRKLGVTIAIDDFGTGYSSLAYLRRLPLDVIKIDRSFVVNMGGDEEDAQVVKTILALASILRLKTVAEGVETVDQFRLLAAAGCDFGQGYLMSRPLPAKDAAREWLAPRGATFSPRSAEATLSAES